MSWETVTFGSICNLVNGKAFKPSDWSTSGVPIIRIQNLNGAGKPFNFWAGSFENQVLVKAGDLLLAWSGTPGTSFGSHIWYGPDSVLNQHIFRCDIDRKRVTPEWVKFAVNVQLDQLIQLSHGGVGLKHVTRRVVEELKIPLPTLEEQKRIAEILDRAEALRAKRRAALAQLEEITQSIFLSMFGDPIFNPQKLPRIQLIKLCSSADDIKCGPFGTQLGKGEYTTEGIPLWGIKHVNALFKFPTQEFLEAKTAKRLIQYSIEPGDIVMTRKGTIGNCAVYPESYPLGIMHSDLLRLRVNLQACNPIFLSHQLHYSRDVERQLALISGGAVMPGINVTKLKSLEVLTPPLDLQKEFSRRVAAVEKLKTAHKASLAELDALFASLQYQAFRGKL